MYIQKSNNPIHKQMHCRTRRGKTNTPVPILDQHMAGSVCIVHVRSWPFKSNCAKKSFGQGLVWLLISVVFSPC